MFLCVTINDANEDTISSTDNYDAVFSEVKTGVKDMALISQNSKFAVEQILNDATPCDGLYIPAAKRCLADESFYTPPTNRFLDAKAVYTPATNEYLAATYARFNDDERDYYAATNSIDDGHTADTNISNDECDLAAYDYVTEEGNADETFEYPADVDWEMKELVEIEPEYSFIQDVRTTRFLVSFCQRKAKSSEKCLKCRKPFYGSLL